MTNERLVTTKITEKSLILIRKLAARTGEKQYRFVERILSAEYQRVHVKEKTK